jgi:hypothetical protein
MPKPDFTRKLPASVRPFKTLQDVAKAIVALDNEGRSNFRWEYIGEMALKAANGGDIECVVVPLLIMRAHRVF